VQRNMKRLGRAAAVFRGLTLGFIGLGIGVAQTASGGLGIFQNQSDVGSVVPPGVATFDAATGVYTIRSAGGIFGSTSTHSTLCGRSLGRPTLTADVKLADAAQLRVASQGVAMFRQTLDSDAMYADAPIHGSGERRCTTGATRATPRRTSPSTLARRSGCGWKSAETRSRSSSARTASRCTRWERHQAALRRRILTPGSESARTTRDAVEQATFAHVELQPLVPSANGCACGNRTPATTPTSARRHGALQHSPDHRIDNKCAHGLRDPDRQGTDGSAQLEPATARR